MQELGCGSTAVLAASPATSTYQTSDTHREMYLAVRFTFIVYDCNSGWRARKAKNDSGVARYVTGA